MKITNGFIKYFVSIGPTLARDIPQDNKSSTTYMENRVFWKHGYHPRDSGRSSLYHKKT